MLLYLTDSYCITHVTISPLCHSERSGTDIENQAIKSKNAAESNPEGAPAGGISALAYGIIHYIQTRPTLKTSAIAARCKNARPPKPTKNFPQEHPPQTKRNKSSQCKGGCSWGKFGVGQGGLEGRETPPKGVSLRLQGLPFHPSRQTFSPNVSGRAGSNCSFAHITVTRSSVSERLMMLCV